MKKFIIGFCMLSCVVSAQELTYNTYKVDVSNAIKDSYRIRSVVEETDHSFSVYYLIRQENGLDKRFGTDKVLFIDVAQPDKESEGFIRFVDNDTQNVGLLNEFAEEVIPPIYTGMTSVQNGMVVALSNGKRENIGSNGDSHWILTGGETVLLDTLNNVLVRNFREPINELDYYSLQIGDKEYDDANYESFLGVNGNYYSFLNLDKKFKSEIIGEFLQSTKSVDWQSFLSDNVAISVELNNGEIGTYEDLTKKEFLSKYNNRLKQVFADGRKSASKSDWNKLVISVDVGGGLIEPSQIEESKRSLYFDAFGDWRRNLFPFFSLNIKEDKGSKKRSNHFEFYRDIDGKFILYRIVLRSNYF